MPDYAVGIPIGVFDSGVGGLSVLKAIHAQIPQSSTIYLADQLHVPYGLRRLEEVRDFSAEITRFLISRGARLIVVACNTASAAALHYLRQEFPAVPIVGMEPAVKPAAEQTRSGVVGVLATQATFQGALYASVVERFANGVQILPDTCPGLVAQIESGQLDSPQTQAILENALQPMLMRGIDTIVLGCTHYPFVIPTIQKIVGPEVRVIDPAPAVARQVQRVLALHWPGPNIGESSQHAFGDLPARFMTTGDPKLMQPLVKQLIGIDTMVDQLVWSSTGLQESAAATPNSCGVGR
jgi:glutamate racemase